MSKVIACANQKGGVAKTTTTVSLGIGLARKGRRVLLIDNDPQGSLTQSLGCQEPDKLEVTLAEIMDWVLNEEKFDLEAGIIHHEEGVDILPGNMSKIFGELLMLIEKDYRGTKATLAYNGLQFAVPKNVYIIGMMNTADRSLALIDYALRRRFSFFAMEPGFTSEGFVSYMENFQNDTFVELIDRIRELNAEITKDSSLGSGFCIGHSYFCGEKECTDEWMQSVVEYDILPMLAEYWFDESSKLQKWQNILRGVFND